MASCSREGVQEAKTLAPGLLCLGLEPGTGTVRPAPLSHTFGPLVYGVQGLLPVQDGL